MVLINKGRLKNSRLGDNGDIEASMFFMLGGGEKECHSELLLGLYFQSLKSPHLWQCIHIKPNVIMGS